MQLTEQTGVSLSPARVLRTEGGRVEVALLDELIWAEPALAVPRELHPEDHVLVIRQQPCAYIIGVLASEAPTTLTMEGDLRIHAPAGRIECLAGRGISVTAPDLHIIAHQAQVIVHSITESFAIATRVIKGLFVTRAGSVIQETEGDHRVQAGSVTSLSTGITRIDGKSVHLG